MWIFTKNSFVSIVQAQDRPHEVLIRARRRADLVRLFPKDEARISDDADRDYRFRLLVKKSRLAKLLSVYIESELTYGNFKAAQERDEPAWMGFLTNVWAAGYKYQQSSSKRK